MRSSKQKIIFATNQLQNGTAEILLYGYIGMDGVCANDFVKQLNDLVSAGNTCINVRINTKGGDVFEGLTMYNAVKNCPVPVDTYVDGLAGSMGSIVAVAGRKVYISKIGQFMTHQPSTGGYGTSEDLKHNAALLDAVEKNMCDIYQAKTGKSADECKALFLNGKDNYFNAEKAIECKLADECYDLAGMIAPAATVKEVNELWDEYQFQFAAKITQTNTDYMKQFFLPAAVIAELGLTAVSDQAQFDAAVSSKFSDMVAKAKGYDTLKAQLDEANGKLKAAEAAKLAAEIDTVLDAAVTEKKMTVEMKATFATQFANNLDGLKAVVATLKPFESITKKSDEGNSRLKELTAKKWDDLDKDGELIELKGLSPDTFKAKYKEKFKKDYAG